MKNISSLLFFILALGFLSCKTQNKTEDKPNFIIFIADDAAWNDVHMGIMQLELLTSINLRKKVFGSIMLS